MSRWFNVRNVSIGGGLIAAVFLFPRTNAKLNPINNVFETQAVKNVGDRYSTGGGSTTHLPAVATPRGDAGNTASPQMKAKGIGSAHFQDNHADQKADGPSIGGKALNQALYGERGENGK